MEKERLLKLLTEPVVREFGYEVYRLPLHYKGAYVGRDLLLLAWFSKSKREKCVRPIRVVSERYVLVPHSTIVREMEEIGVKPRIIQTGTRFQAEVRRETSRLLVENSYYYGSFRLHIYVQVDTLDLPIWTDFLRVPHIRSVEGLFTKESISEALEFGKAIVGHLKLLRGMQTPKGLQEFVKSLKVVRREYHDGKLVKEEVDEVGKRIFSKLLDRSFYSFVIKLLLELTLMAERGYAYRRLKERVERYLGKVISSYLELERQFEKFRFRRGSSS